MTKKLETQESLAQVLHDDLNKEGLQTFLLGMDTTPTDIVDFVSTGVDILDLAIANRPHAGIACGRITELSGLQGTGKSLLAAHMMANVQKEGGVACLLDSETAVNEEFFEAIGINIKELVYRRPSSAEEVFESIERIIEIVRRKNHIDKKVIIVVDSITAFPTKQEIEGGYDREGYGTGKARLMSDGLKKLVSVIGEHKIALVFTNQLRMKLDVGNNKFADKWMTPGGMSLPFYASTRIRLTMTGKIKNKQTDTVIGVHVNANIEKNRIGPPHRKVDFDIYFDRGVDNDTSTLGYLRKQGIINSTSYVDDKGNKWTITEPAWKQFMVDHPDVIEELHQKMAKSMILSYKSTTATGDTLTTSEEGGAVIVGERE